MDSATFTSTVLLSLLFMDYYNYCINAISDLITSIGRYYETRDYFLKFNIVRKSDEEAARDIALKVESGNIVFKNLTLKYENKIVLNNFNFTIDGKSITGILGPIGSGKTTVLKVLAGILDYDGDIIIDGQNLKNCSYESIVKNIAYISQHPKLFNRSVYYNLNYGSSFTKKEISDKIEKLGLKPFIDSLSDKLDTISGKEGGKLSGGQKQFIFFIRSVIQNKSIFLLDEPTSSLDPYNKNILIGLIKRMKNKTFIISTHDKEIMPLFNKTLIMGE
jgi:ABC-type bacteriocin/lantibiotic exporter with double-glycine peptidase domain